MKRANTHCTTRSRAHGHVGDFGISQVVQNRKGRLLMDGRDQDYKWISGQANRTVNRLPFKRRYTFSGTMPPAAVGAYRPFDRHLRRPYPSMCAVEAVFVFLAVQFTQGTCRRVTPVSMHAEVGLDSAFQDPLGAGLGCFTKTGFSGRKAGRRFYGPRCEACVCGGRSTDLFFAGIKSLVVP